jgi:hypothetical protein
VLRRTQKLFLSIIALAVCFMLGATFWLERYVRDHDRASSARARAAENAEHIAEAQQIRKAASCARAANVSAGKIEALTRELAELQRELRLAEENQQRQLAKLQSQQWTLSSTPANTGAETSARGTSVARPAPPAGPQLNEMCTHAFVAVPRPNTCSVHPGNKAVWCYVRDMRIDNTKIRKSEPDRCPTTLGPKALAEVNAPDDPWLPKYEMGAFSAPIPLQNNVLPHRPVGYYVHDVVEAFTREPLSESNRCRHWVQEHTFFITRYDYVNLFHTTADWFNVFTLRVAVQHDVLHKATAPTTFKLPRLPRSRDSPGMGGVIWLDGHQTGNLDATWRALFGSAHFVGDLGAFPSERGTCFRHAHFVPAGYSTAIWSNSAPAVPPPCHALMERFVWEMFSAHRLSVVKVRMVPGTALLIDRTPHRMHPRSCDPKHDDMKHDKKCEARRYLTNTKNVSMALSQQGWKVRVADLSVLTMREQLEAVRTSEAIVGLHGAGMSHLLFASERARVLELTPQPGLTMFKYFAEWRPHVRYFRGQISGTCTKWCTLKLKKLLCGMAATSHHAGAEAWPCPGLGEVRSDETRRRVVGAGPDSTEADPEFMRERSGSERSVPPPTSARPPPTFSTLDKSGHRLAVIVPFRDDGGDYKLAQGLGRWENLKEFVPLICAHLSKAERAFEVVVAEEVHGQPWNKGKLFNAAYLTLQRENSTGGVPKSDFFVFHDVDQIPTSPKNTYSFPASRPVHLVRSTAQNPNFNYDVVGGALLITGAQFEKVDGYSNRFEGWGQEDQDMAHRIKHHIAKGYDRLDTKIGRYRALKHPRVKGLDVTKQFNHNGNFLRATKQGKPGGGGLSDLEFDVLKDTTLPGDVYRCAGGPAVRKLTFGFKPEPPVSNDPLAASDPNVWHQNKKAEEHGR